MAHFARIDENNGVTTVVVVPDDQEHRGNAYLNELGLDGRWIQTSYNSVAGIHYGPGWIPDGKPALRKNYAGIGYTYDEVRDAFIPPKPPDDLFVFDEEKCIWVPPIQYPTDGKAYVWDIVQHTWRQIPQPSP